MNLTHLSLAPPPALVAADAARVAALAAAADAGTTAAVSPLLPPPALSAPPPSPTPRPNVTAWPVSGPYAWHSSLEWQWRAPDAFHQVLSTCCFLGERVRQQAFHL